MHWPFGPSRPQDLYRDAYVAHPDRFDWRKRCGAVANTSQLAHRSATASPPLQRRRASASMVKGEESKIAAKARRTAERKMDDRSLRISREKAAQLLSRNAEREPIRQQAKLYRENWAELLNYERTQELATIAERRKAPIDKLVEEGIAIDGLQAYWQDDSKRHFGKRVAVFKLDAAEPLPRTLFRAGDKVTIMPSTAPVPQSDDPESILQDELVIEAEVVERQRTYLRLKFDESDEDVDLVSCPSWRLDYGFNDLTFERIKAALEALEHDVEHIETHYGSRFQYILSGTRLSDVILGIEPPADRVTRGAFWEDARVQSWYDRFSRQHPIVIEGDPLPELNRSQTQAVAMMLRERVSLIQGPPGTGKTRTIVTAIKLLKQDFRVPHPIMLAAHTNVAVDNLADGCIKAGLRVVRIGPSARARAGIDEYTLDAYFLRHPAKPRLDQIKKRLDTLDRLKSEYELGRMGGFGTSSGSALREELEEGEAAIVPKEAQSWEDVMAEREEEREAAQPQGGTASEEYEAIKKQLNRLKATYFFLRASIRGEILNGADVICGSAIAAGSPELDMIDLPVVFFDEASMATEPVSLVPLMKGCRHLSIIGDHKQLPPVVTSVEAKQGGLSRSLFERLIQSESNIPSTMLNVQFRMHPTLAEFPNKTFYDGALENGQGTELIAPVASSYWPASGNTAADKNAHRLCFIDHKGRETKAENSTSLCNAAEARIVVDVVVDLLRQNPELTGDDIGVVTPYAGQQILLEKMLHNEASPARKQAASVLATRASELGSINMHTVDGFEGREKKVILFSTVRTNAHGYVGFLADARRLNVALTRAQSALFLIGNIDTFKKAQLSEAAYSRVESPNLEALRRYAAYLEERGAVVRWGSAGAAQVEDEEVEGDAHETREVDPDAADWQHMLAEREAA
ncbi:related to regulator of nonsense transcripts 1 [Sporisorium reilianum f. sp. reilianum]|uniref:Related to regulator of nonsense transcripts 1 n=1 Tax=Sporisorium reilianum f. sp. reilianum TaxID=72559 RepID=A0A2N8UMI1_9BASI|nr:related to regulator of nonsense transcripts 1 [Sporisorium reilianum f. sp. reilianum]